MRSVVDKRKRAITQQPFSEEEKGRGLVLAEIVAEGPTVFEN
jgi:hypothetical protein